MKLTGLDSITLNAGDQPFDVHLATDGTGDYGVEYDALTFAEQPAEPNSWQVSPRDLAIICTPRSGAITLDSLRAAVAGVFNPFAGANRILKALRADDAAVQLPIRILSVTPRSDRTIQVAARAYQPIWETVAPQSDATGTLENAGNVDTNPTITITGGDDLTRYRVTIPDPTPQGDGLANMPVRIDLPVAVADAADLIVFCDGVAIPFAAPVLSPTARLILAVDVPPAASGSAKLDIYHGSAVANTQTANSFEAAGIDPATFSNGAWTFASVAVSQNPPSRSACWLPAVVTQHRTDRGYTFGITSEADDQIELELKEHQVNQDVFNFADDADAIALVSGVELDTLSGLTIEAKTSNVIRQRDVNNIGTTTDIASVLGLWSQVEVTVTTPGVEGTTFEVQHIEFPDPLPVNVGRWFIQYGVFTGWAAFDATEAAITAANLKRAIDSALWVMDGTPEGAHFYVTVTGAFPSFDVTFDQDRPFHGSTNTGYDALILEPLVQQIPSGIARVEVRTRKRDQDDYLQTVWSGTAHASPQGSSIFSVSTEDDIPLDGAVAVAIVIVPAGSDNGNINYGTLDIKPTDGSSFAVTPAPSVAIAPVVSEGIAAKLISGTIHNATSEASITLTRLFCDAHDLVIDTDAKTITTTAGPVMAQQVGFTNANRWWPLRAGPNNWTAPWTAVVSWRDRTAF